MGQAVLERRAADAGLDLTVDSAGVAARREGSPPDPRGLAAARARGYDTGAQRSKQLRAADFDDFDLILAMDATNLADLERLRPPGARAEARLFDPEGGDIPDPYHGGHADYEHALDLIEAAAARLIAGLGQLAERER